MPDEPLPDEPPETTVNVVSPVTWDSATPRALHKDQSTESLYAE